MESHIKTYQGCKNFTLVCHGEALGLERPVRLRRVEGFKSRSVHFSPFFATHCCQLKYTPLLFFCWKLNFECSQLAVEIVPVPLDRRLTKKLFEPENKLGLLLLRRLTKTGSLNGKENARLVLLCSRKHEEMPFP